MNTKLRTLMTKWRAQHRQDMALSDAARRNGDDDGFEFYDARLDLISEFISDIEEALWSDDNPVN